MAVGIEAEKVAEGLDGDGGAGDWVLFGCSLLGEAFQFLLAGGAKMAALAGEVQKVLMVAVLALDPGKAVLQDAAIQVSVNDILAR